MQTAQATLTAVPRTTRGRLITRFIPKPDISECHETVIQAPADLVMDVARNIHLESLPLVHAIFWLRGKLMGAAPPPAEAPRGLVALTRALGWGTLAVRHNREYVAGAVTQPWKADVVFRAIPADDFARFSEPDLVKIVWTLEANPLGPARTLFRTETRVVATDDRARTKFRRYWRWAGMGIVLIRWLLLPELRRQAERRYDAESGRVLTHTVR